MAELKGDIFSPAEFANQIRARSISMFVEENLPTTRWSTIIPNRYLQIEPKATGFAGHREISAYIVIDGT